MVIFDITVGTSITRKLYAPSTKRFCSLIFAFTEGQKLDEATTVTLSGKVMIQKTPKFLAVIVTRVAVSKLKNCDPNIVCQALALFEHATKADRGL